jgi:hypothetical protein
LDPALAEGPVHGRPQGREDRRPPSRADGGPRKEVVPHLGHGPKERPGTEGKVTGIARRAFHSLALRGPGGGNISVCLLGCGFLTLLFLGAVDNLAPKEGDPGLFTPAGLPLPTDEVGTLQPPQCPVHLAG